jgi:hypothetical protein
MVDAESLEGADWAKTVVARRREATSARGRAVDGIRRIRNGSGKTITPLIGIWLSAGGLLLKQGGL